MPAIRFANDAEWHALRDAHIGGSDVASLFNIWEGPDGQTAVLHVYEAPPEGWWHVECLSPYKSSFRLFQEKSGHLAPDFAESERMTAGKHLEPALAAWAQQKWPDWKLRKVRRYLEHDEVPMWGATRDYEVVAPGHPPAEFKNVDWLVFRDQWKGEGEDLTPPLHVNLQLQSQIGVGTDKTDHGWFVVCVGGNALHRVKVPRHEESQQRIREAIEQFQLGVQQQIVPAWLADADTVSKLACLAVDDKAPAVDLTDDEAARRDFRRFMRWKRHSDFIAKGLDGMKARIGLRMTDRTRATLPEGTVTWPVVNRAAKQIPSRWQDASTYRGGFTCKPPKEAK